MENLNLTTKNEPVFKNLLLGAPLVFGLLFCEKNAIFKKYFSMNSLSLTKDFHF